LDSGLTWFKTENKVRRTLIDVLTDHSLKMSIRCQQELNSHPCGVDILYSNRWGYGFKKKNWYSIQGLTIRWSNFIVDLWCLFKARAKLSM